MVLALANGSWHGLCVAPSFSLTHHTRLCFARDRILLPPVQAQFEFKLKAQFQKLLKTKKEKWGAMCTETKGMLGELSDYFTGAW